MKKRSKTVLAAILTLCLALGLALVGCGGGQPSGSSGSGSASASASSSAAPAAGKYSSAQDLDGKIVAAQSGTTGADWVTENLPGATLKNFNMTSEALAALVAGDVEAVFFDEPVAAEQVATTYKDCVILETIPTGEQYGFAVSKTNPTLKAKVNATLQTLKANGQFDTIFKKWFPDVSPPSLKESASDAAAADGELKLVESGTLIVASDCDYPPFIEMDGDKPAGFEYELMQAICAELGLTLKYLPPQNFDGILASVAAGTVADIGVSSFTINDERKQLVDFCTPYFDSNQACVVLKSKAA
ncbi:MAG: transporter substrate-binding domain-containing protein [Coriobacteriales bacterium]|nr:transporter substrate-binding domain-containing protein [Coriobacteriales bacterium]